MRTFAISDIHGNYDELIALLAKLIVEANFNLREDRLVILGDMIDRGPKTKQVVQHLMDLEKEFGKDHVVCLYGNHEDLMLDALMYQGRIYHSFDLWWTQGGRETFQSYLPENLSNYEKSIMQVKDVISKEHMEWLAALPTFFEDDKYIYVHGGLVPGKQPEEGDRPALIWARDLFIDSDYDWGKKVIFGHTPNDKPGKWGGEKKWDPIVLPNKIGIDTVSRVNKMTAVELPAEKFYFEPKHEEI